MKKVQHKNVVTVFEFLPLLLYIALIFMTHRRRFKHGPKLPLPLLMYSKNTFRKGVYVVPPGFEDDPTAVRTFDASGEEAGRL